MEGLARITDVETTGLAPPEHAIVELAALDVVDGRLDAARRSFVNPVRPIPPEASAVHHIVDADVADAPPIELVAPAVLMCGRPRVLVAHYRQFESQWLDLYACGVPWICTMKSAMRVWPEAPFFGNQFLRYWLHLGDLGSAAAQPHRALPDCFVTAHIFQRLLQEASIEDMIAWTLEPTLWPRVPFGKHEGEPWSSPPVDYFDWVLRQPDRGPSCPDGMEPDIKWNARREIKRRADAAREAYTIDACAIASAKPTVQDLELWFRSNSWGRSQHGIVDGAPEYARIVKACADRKRDLLSAPTMIPNEGVHGRIGQ